uniref:Sodium/calcium exchanger membrane region domain-containing protein n=1 Tax=Timema shepardi TaxID=629360 RepID=A0A7R9FWF3_TIMSH|nr:unnamed protein product [Timema shepardi]
MRVVPLDWWPLTRDCLAYGVTVSLMICIIHDERVEWYEALTLKKNIAKKRPAVPAPSWPRPDGSAQLSGFAFKKFVSSGEKTGEVGVPLQTDAASPQHQLQIQQQQLQQNGRIKVSTDRVPQEDSQDEESVNRRVENLLGKYTPDSPDRDSNLDLTVLDSLAQHETSAFANYATEKPRFKKWFPLTFIMCIIWIGSLSYVVAWMITIIGQSARLKSRERERVKKHLEKKTNLSTPDWDSNLDISIISKLVYCETDVLDDVATEVGDTLKIPDSVMGITFLAAGTSVPEAVSSVIVAKQGYQFTAKSEYFVPQYMFREPCGTPARMLLSWELAFPKVVEKRTLACFRSSSKRLKNRKALNNSMKMLIASNGSFLRTALLIPSGPGALFSLRAAITHDISVSFVVYVLSKSIGLLLVRVDHPIMTHNKWTWCGDPNQVPRHLPQGPVLHAQALNLALPDTIPVFLDHLPNRVDFVAPFGLIYWGGALLGAEYSGELVTDGLENMKCGAVQAVVQHVHSCAKVHSPTRTKPLFPGYARFHHGSTGFLSLPALVTYQTVAAPQIILTISPTLNQFPNYGFLKTLSSTPTHPITSTQLPKLDPFQRLLVHLQIPTPLLLSNSENNTRN